MPATSCQNRPNGSRKRGTKDVKTEGENESSKPNEASERGEVRPKKEIE